MRRQWCLLMKKDPFRFTEILRTPFFSLLGPIESVVVELNPKKHLAVNFKENLDPNSNLSSQPKGVLERENSLVDSNGGNNRRGKALSKTIRGCGGRFKVVGNSHVPLPKTMASIARLIGSQAVLEEDRTV
ncbi:hypothetical protein GOBAR_AA18468 [Gossypium barbadense]|uniref:Uncharacterized protein n=1 Tax=Gossypium barbadense TaxID=3634 RepID=A0A2P5XFT2_GOSBA|nr:hypothetical protein GOBAR_AA18468 [Gossypium barbadense]